MKTQLRYRISNPKFETFIVESSEHGFKWDKREGLPFRGAIYSRDHFYTLEIAEYALSQIRYLDEYHAKREEEKKNFVPLETKYY